MTLKVVSQNQTLLTSHFCLGPVLISSFNAALTLPNLESISGFYVNIRNTEVMTFKVTSNKVSLTKLRVCASIVLQSQSVLEKDFTRMPH